MNPAAIVLMVVGLLIAGATGLLINVYLQDKVDIDEAASLPTVEMAHVLVSDYDLPLGTVLRSRDLTWQQWPAEIVSDPTLITAPAGPDVEPPGAHEFTDQVLRVSMVKGEPMTANKAYDPEQASLLSAVLEPGMRAIGVEVDATTGAAGLIKPGDRVDVLLTVEARDLSDDRTVQATLPRFVTETVLRNARVLASDKVITPDTDTSKDRPAKNVTIEVSPGQAELVVTAAAMGDISLIITSFALAASDGPMTADNPLSAFAGMLQRTVNGSDAAGGPMAGDPGGFTTMAHVMRNFTTRFGDALGAAAGLDGNTVKSHASPAPAPEPTLTREASTRRNGAAEEPSTTQVKLYRASQQTVFEFPDKK